MLLPKLVPGELAVELGRISDARCERCAWPRPDGSFYLVQAYVVLEQVRNPNIAYMKVIGCCKLHYPAQLAERYKEHGWKVILKPAR